MRSGQVQPTSSCNYPDLEGPVTLIRSRIAVRTLGLVGLLALATPLTAIAQNTLVPDGAVRYAPTIFPDRIVLTFAGDPATSQAVSWRTDSSVAAAVAQVVLADDTPAIENRAVEVRGETVPLRAVNGLAHHHTVTFGDLEPGTLYAYRVGGGGTWSEWFQFRTAAADAEPFSFLYFGDAQNAVKSHVSRVIRQAALDLPEARFMLHAGDLVNLRDDRNDDEWGEWFDAGGWLHGTLPSIVTTGNHEYVYEGEGEARERVLSPHWAPQFALPANGPVNHPDLRETVYYVDYQGVRIISLNSTAALSHGLAEEQARWLEGVLTDNSNRWTVVTYHHPMHSVSLGRDNPELRDHWQPLFDRYGVDLVLQGHDHTYGRHGSNVAEGTRAYDARTGTMYVVSVSGPKMYFISDEAEEVMTRLGEDTQLYQTIHVDGDRLRYESLTVTGRLYDAFDLVKGGDGRNELIDRSGQAIPERRCSRPEIPGYRDTRCWEGTEFGGEPASHR
jgi:acid phosphatase type 7